MAKAPNWTPAEVGTAVAMRQAGHLISEIAAVIGRPANATQVKLAKMRVCLSPERLAEIRLACAKAARNHENYGEKRSKALSAAYTPERRAAAGRRAKELRIWEKGAAMVPMEAKLRGCANGNKGWAKLRTGWCPPHMRAQYRKMTAGGHGRFTAAEARAILEGEWLNELRRALRQIAAVAADEHTRLEAHRRSFAGQMERVKAGARVVPTLGSMKRAVGHERSLTGNATGMCAA